MEKQIIEFKAVNGQRLERITPLRAYASDTINYIEAHFELDDFWYEYTELFAVWYTERMQEASAIGADGVTVIPAELLSKPGLLKMNLCANYIEGDKLKGRMTSYPVDVLEITKTRV